MRVEAVDSLISMRNNPSEAMIHEWLMEEWKLLKDLADANGERVILNDYLHHPDKPFGET